MKKQRLDVLLTERGLFTTRSQAAAAIMAGQILVNEQKIDKPGAQVDGEAAIRLVGQKLPYVSRGGLKLAKAIEVFDLQLEGKVVADLGASTGGFTDCSLQHGAAKVYAVDVGYGQLAWSLRQDPRVVNMERTNVRNLTAESLGEPVDVATIDLAFISLEKVLEAVKSILRDGGLVMALVKPQFEAGRENVGKKGVVRDPKVHLEVLERICAFARATGFKLKGLDFSPVRGPEGNIEYLLLMGLAGEDTLPEGRINEVVRASHETLDKGGEK